MRTLRAIPLVCLLLAISSLGACSKDPVASASAGTPSAGSASPVNTVVPGSSSAQAAGVAQGKYRLGSPTADMAAEFTRRCKEAPADSLECDVFRGVLVFELTNVIIKAGAAKDRRSVEPALAALALTEEPEILVAACRLLGHFPETPNLAAKLIPLLLESPYIQVQEKAAAVLAATPDPETQYLGRFWVDNHTALSSKSPGDEYPDFPDHYAKLGFPKYPGATWFSPADSDRSIGWSTTDDPATVARWFGTTLSAEVLDSDKWAALQREQTLLVMQSAMNPATMTRMQQLMEKMVGGKATPAENDEYAKLAKSLEDGQKNMEAGINNAIGASSIVQMLMPRDAKWVVARKKGERVSQVVVVFPMAAVKRTGIAMVWDRTDFPGAWPASEQ